MSETPTPPVVEPVSTPADFEAMYRKEVEGRIAERNLYKPAQQMLNGLTDGAKAEVLKLAQMAQAGDTQAIVDWALMTAQDVSQKDLASLIAERQTQENDDQKPQPGMTAQEVAEMVRNETARTLQEHSVRQQGEARVRQELSALGYDLDSAAGMTIINRAVALGCDVGEATKWFEGDVEKTFAERARNAAAAAATVPGTAPNGTPAATVPDTPREGESPDEFRRRSIMAKLSSPTPTSS